MNSTAPQVILSAEGFHARPEVTAHAEAKAGKLRRHNFPRIGHVRVHVKRETPHSSAPHFAVCVTAETGGPDYVAHAAGAEPEIALNTAFAKLDRAITAAAGARKHERHREIDTAESTMTPFA